MSSSTGGATNRISTRGVPLKDAVFLKDKNKASKLKQRPLVKHYQSQDITIMETARLYLGTCSWKYSSWAGLVYSQKKPANYLLEYSRCYNTVEIDQWFWSLFAGDTVVLPKPAVVADYAASVPDTFIFSIKVPNSITLTHHYKKRKDDKLITNPHFLSVEMMCRFLELIAPLGKRIGPLNFQFEYLNRQKMSSFAEFADKFGAFIDQLPSGFTYCVETRNPNYLSAAYFDFLTSQNLSHVFLHGYYMPPIFEVFRKFQAKLTSPVVIRLHGPERKEIEEITGDDWSTIVSPRDRDLAALTKMLTILAERQLTTFVFVNNHFEGSAPRTITRVRKLLAD